MCSSPGPHPVLRSWMLRGQAKPWLPRPSSLNFLCKAWQQLFSSVPLLPRNVIVSEALDEGIGPVGC